MSKMNIHNELVVYVDYTVHGTDKNALIHIQKT